MLPLTVLAACIKSVTLGSGRLGLDDGGAKSERRKVPSLSFDHLCTAQRNRHRLWEELNKRRTSDGHATDKSLLLPSSLIVAPRPAFAAIISIDSLVCWLILSTYATIRSTTAR